MLIDEVAHTTYEFVLGRQGDWNSKILTQCHTSFGVCKKKRKEKIENLTCTNVFGKLYTIPMVSKEVQENRMESLERLESRIPPEVDLYSRRENH